MWLLYYFFVLQDESIRQFLEEGTALDPRFKTKVGDEVWTRLQEELVTRISQQVFFVIDNILFLFHCRSVYMTPIIYWIQNKGVTQAQQMEQELEGTAGDHDDNSSDEDCTAAVTAQVK